MESPVSLHGCLSTSPHDGRSPLDERSPEVPSIEVAHGAEQSNVPSDEADTTTLFTHCCLIVYVYSHLQTMCSGARLPT